MVLLLVALLWGGVYGFGSERQQQETEVGRGRPLTCGLHDRFSGWRGIVEEVERCDTGINCMKELENGSKSGGMGWPISVQRSCAMELESTVGVFALIC